MLVAPLVVIFMPTVLLLAIALLPTFVAVVVDKGPKRYGGITVGGLNFSGTVPYIFDLWSRDHSVEHALRILSDVVALMMIFGSAAVGWLLYMTAPVVVVGFLSATATRRLAQMKDKQKQLIEDWGPEVAQAEIPLVEDHEEEDR